MPSPTTSSPDDPNPEASARKIVDGATLEQRLRMIESPSTSDTALAEIAVSDRWSALHLLTRDIHESLVSLIADAWVDDEMYTRASSHPNAPVVLKLSLDACIMSWPSLTRFFRQVNASAYQREKVLEAIELLDHRTLGEIWATVAPKHRSVNGVPMSESAYGIELVQAKGDTLADVIERALGYQAPRRVAAAIRAIAETSPEELPQLAEFDDAQLRLLVQRIEQRQPLPAFAR